MSKTKKPKNNPQRRARPSGWSTSDADEIERRRLRGINEAIRIESLTQDDVFFGVFQTHSGSGRAYRVEIRSLAEPINSCDCPDHRVNGLGTCKHIEATLYRLQHRRKRAFQKAAARGSPYIEIFLDRRDHQTRIRWPSGSQRRSRARDILAPFFIQVSRYLVKDFGTSKSPKSTRKRDAYCAPAALRPCRFTTPSQARRWLRSTPSNGWTAC